MSTEPNDTERALAEELIAVLIGHDLSTSTVARTLAEALAAHRARCVGFARAAVQTLNSREGAMPQRTLERMRDGWTPEEVRRLIDAHHRLTRDLEAVPRLIDDALAGRTTGLHGSDAPRGEL